MTLFIWRCWYVLAYTVWIITFQILNILSISMIWSINQSLNKSNIEKFYPYYHSDACDCTQCQFSYLYNYYFRGMLLHYNYAKSKTPNELRKNNNLISISTVKLYCFGVVWMTSTNETSLPILWARWVTFLLSETESRNLT